jgi:hypothetical protein
VLTAATATYSATGCISHQIHSFHSEVESRRPSRWLEPPFAYIINIAPERDARGYIKVGFARLMIVLREPCNSHQISSRVNYGVTSNTTPQPPGLTPERRACGRVAAFARGAEDIPAGINDGVTPFNGLTIDANGTLYGAVDLGGGNDPVSLPGTCRWSGADG